MAALDHEVLAFLAQRLRTYYDNIRNTAVPEALSTLLKEIEQKTDKEIEQKTDKERLTSS